MPKSSPGTGATPSDRWVCLPVGQVNPRSRLQVTRSVAGSLGRTSGWARGYGWRGWFLAFGRLPPDGHQVRAGVDTVSNSAGGRDAG